MAYCIIFGFILHGAIKSALESGNGLPVGRVLLPKCLASIAGKRRLQRCRRWGEYDRMNARPSSS